MEEIELNKFKERATITSTDCIQILEKALGREQIFKLLNYEVKPANDSVGYLGEYYHLQLEYISNKSTNSQTLRLFVKTLPYKNVNISKFMKDIGIMRKEARLYVKLLNKLQKFSNRLWCAKCYLARKDLIVLEDVKEMGYESFEDQTKYFTKAQINSVLNSLATMHASSIVYEVRHDVSIGEEFKDVLFELSFVLNNAWFEVGKMTILELAARHPAHQTAALQDYIQHKLSKDLSKILEIVNPSKKYRNVFCHRDLWAGNIFFKPEDKHNNAILVDFQLCRYSPPAIDVLMVLYLGLHPVERKTNMKNYILHYYEQFRNALNAQNISADEHMTLQEFKQSLEDLTLFGVFYNCLCATTLRLPRNFLNDMKIERPAELDDFMHVERTKMICDLMEKHTDYRRYINKCIEDLLGFLASKGAEEY